jgi:hypothetical protein
VESRGRSMDGRTTRRRRVIGFPEQSPSFRPSSQRYRVRLGHFADVVRTVEALHATLVVTAPLLFELFYPVALIGFYLARQRNAAVKC